MKENNQITNEISRLLGVPSQWLNKFTIVSLVFLIWILFLDKYNVFASSKINGIISKMELEKKSYEHKIAQAILDKQDLEKNHEKYAREKHFMHKPGEQIVIIEKQKPE